MIRGSEGRELNRSWVPLLVVFLAGALEAAPPPDLRWGGDAEGGAPFVEADPSDPSKVRGFDVAPFGVAAIGVGRIMFIRALTPNVRQR